LGSKDYYLTLLINRGGVDYGSKQNILGCGGDMMNTKDTIDVLKYHYNIKEGLFKSVVELLERGEKYEIMWEKSKKDLLRASARNWKVSLESVISEIKKLEQEYFPR